MKMALQYWLGRGKPQKHRMVTVRGGYHGDTLGAMAVCDPLTGMHHMFSAVLPQYLFAPEPTPGFREPFDETHLEALVALLHAHRDEIAALILEPVVQGAGGMRFYAPAYLAGVRSLCDEFGILLIVDEIATGFGRTGKLFGCDHAGIAPDIICLGKALTGGYLSLAATLCTSEVAQWVSRAEAGALMHGPTYMGNPLGCAVALASIRVLLGQPWAARIDAIGTRLSQDSSPPRAWLTSAMSESVRRHRGYRDQRAPPHGGHAKVFLDHGVWLRPFGRLIYTMPPYITTDEEIDRIAGAMVAAVEQVPRLKRVQRAGDREPILAISRWSRRVAGNRGR